MITITRRLRSVVASPASETQVLQYHIERAKIQVEESSIPEILQETHHDPLVSHFQPFGKGIFPVAAPPVFEKKSFLGSIPFWNGLYWSLGICVLTIAITLTFQLFLTHHNYHGPTSPLPR
jgi:quinol-cytochrome oxidoreductase complex cytochrome b subunit